MVAILIIRIPGCDVVIEFDILPMILDQYMNIGIMVHYCSLLFDFCYMFGIIVMKWQPCRSQVLQNKCYTDMELIQGNLNKILDK